MTLGCCKVLLWLFTVTWISFPQSTDGARNDERCNVLLRRLLRNPPNNTKIAINTGLSKARYTCYEGYKLVGKEVRTCRGGKWRESVEPKCFKPCGKPEDIQNSKVVGSSFNFNDQLRYECIKGYTLTGNRSRTCGEDGKWSEAPRCEEIVPCGQSLVYVRARIVGGTISQRGMWPWQIAIYRIIRNVPQFLCGGALVSRRWVLTAAHCFYPRRRLLRDAKLYLIKAGDHNLSVNEDMQQEIVPEKIFVHPRFKPTGVPFYDGDIALVKLSQEVELSKFVRTVCLPEEDERDLAIPKTRGTVAGWGITRSLRPGEPADLSDISKVLRHASFSIQSDQLCINKSSIQFNTKTAFCAGDGRGGKDACRGDSGGAFVREIRNSKYVVVGVVSWGDGCAQKIQYGYYTRVHPFLEWIKETMNERKEPENSKPTNQCSNKTVRQQRRRGINLNEDCGLDLVFLFDASVTVKKFYFQTSLEFAKELLTIIGASKRSAKTRVAAVTEAKLEFNLGDSKADTIDKAIKAIDNIMYVGWVSSYILPFKLVRNKVAPNVRNDSHQVMIFITDGMDLSGSVRREAKYLRDNKEFDVYAIGIGRRVKTRALMSIASANKDHDHVISVRKYRNLQEAVRRVILMDIVLSSCQSPGGIAHGNKYGSDYSHGKTVWYECDAAYTLEGKNRLTCNDGKWNYNPPQCKDSCQSPGGIAHGYKFGTDYRHGKTVRYQCGGMHTLKGKTRLTCNDGKWNYNPPRCEGLSPGLFSRAGTINLNGNVGLDLVFVIQSSSSVNDLLTGLRFAKMLVRTIGTSERRDGTRIAAVSFGTDARLEFNLGEAKVDTTEKALEAIDKIMYMAGATASALALRMVRRVVVPQAREDSQRVMMFITDGMSNIGGPSQKDAKRLREEENFEIYAIGVGKRVRIRELMGIASADENQYHVISVKNYNNLQSAIKRVVYIKIDYSPCGVSPVDFRARIVGGKVLKRGWWPWQIGLYKNNDEVPPKVKLICGGALISHRWILTVAHCFYHFDPIFGKREFKRNPGGYLVKVGDYNLLRKERSQQDIRPEKFFVHQDYVDGKFVNDIALIKLKDKVELSPFVRTLCLPDRDEGDLAIPMKYGFVTGWGVTQALKLGEKAKPENEYSTRLQYSAFQIQSDELCANRSSPIVVNSTVAFCAGDGKGGNGTCHGDSGGAFVREGKRGEGYRWVATGLDSWSNGCAQKNQYGYYTRVYPFTDWIKNTIKENSEE